ncbi:hypothetical protein ACTS9D_00715 [Empedobacter brevis]
MDKQYLNKKQLEKRIERLNEWLIQKPNDPMVGIAKKESVEYINLLAELESSNEKTIVNTCRTQIFQQIGVLL